MKNLVGSALLFLVACGGTTQTLPPAEATDETYTTAHEPPPVEDVEPAPGEEVEEEPALVIEDQG